MALNASGIFTAFLTQLGFWAARTLVLACCAGLALAIFRVRSTSVRLFTWTTVLYAGLAIPILTFLLPSVMLPVPIRLRSIEPAFSPAPVLVSSPQSRNHIETIGRLESVRTEQTAEPIKAQPAYSPESSPLSWTTIAIASYWAIALLLLVRLGVGLILSRRLVHSAKPVDDSRVMSRTRACNPRLTARVCESERVSVPVTLGIIHPVILLPQSWCGWDYEKLDAILSHEMSHIRRGDAFTQCVALLHRAVFWFSPLSWWLNTHLASLAEQASDEAALSAGADKSRYAKTLLEFVEALQTGTRRVRWQGVSMAHAGNAAKRVERILEWKGAFTMGLKKSGMVIIAVCGIPALFLAASARPFSVEPTPQASVAQVPAPATAPAPQQPPVATPALQAGPGSGVVAPALPAPPAGGVHGSGLPFAPGAPVGLAAPFPPESPWSDRGNRRFSYAYGFDDEERFVIVSGNSDSFTMSGSSEDARHVEKLRKQIPGDFIWFQRDEKSYIIRDQATIDRARKLWAPQEELGKKQEELGKQQEALGKQQEALGKKMEQVRVNVPDMTAELDRLKAKLQKLGPSATVEELGNLQSEIGDLQSKIGEVQSQAGEQQSRLGEQQGKLGAQQGALGAQQGELGRQQGELARKATIQMKAILDEALKNGTAKPEPEAPDSSTL